MIKPDLNVLHVPVGQQSFDLEFDSHDNEWVPITIDMLKHAEVHSNDNVTAKSVLQGKESDIRIRPRLNKPQVLDDYSFIESLEGFVWSIRCYWEYLEKLTLLTNQESRFVSRLINDDDAEVILEWAMLEGVHESSPYVEWAKQNSVPVLNDAGEECFIFTCAE